MEVLILGLTLGEEDNVYTPAEETVTVSTAPLVTMRDEQDGGPTTNRGVSSFSSSRGSMVARLGWREAERSISKNCDING